MTKLSVDPKPENYSRNSVRPKRTWLYIVLGLLALVIYAGSTITIYTVPKNADATRGAALVVKQGPGMPFFDSPDAQCLRQFNNTNFVCRENSLAQMRFVRFYFEIPYMKWLYLLSTGGKEFK